MLIACPNCTSSYRVEPSSLGPAGRSVRCVRCKKVWFAANSAALAAIAYSHRAEVTEFAAATPISDLVAAAEPQPPEPPPEPPPELLPEPPPEWVDDTVETTDVKADWGVAVDPILAAEARRLAAIDDAPALADDPEQPPSNSTPGEEQIPQSQEPIAIADGPALVPVQEEAIALRPAYMGHVEPEPARVSRRPGKSVALRWPRPRLSTAILALVAVNTAMIAWRTEVVRWAPQTAALYASIGLPVNIRGLTFADIATEHATQDGVLVLVVEGSIVSATARAVEVPQLHFALRNDSGLEIYSWTATPTRSVLGPGESLSFRSRLASPPPEGHTVVVRFFNRRDRVAGIQ